MVNRILSLSGKIRPTLIPLIFLTLLLTNCAKQTAIGAIDRPGGLGIGDEISQKIQSDIEREDQIICLLFSPLHWSRHDSDETIRQIKSHNKIIVNFCKGY